MEDVLRKKTVPAVGVVITDRAVEYLALTPQAQDTLRVSAFGQIGIAFDAVEEGVVLSNQGATDTVKRLKQKTSAKTVVMPAWGDERDARWKEIFVIGGFSEVALLPQAHLLDHLLLQADGQSAPILYFSSPETAELFFAGESRGPYSYPWEVETILAMQDFLTQREEDSLRLLGHVPEEPLFMVTLMEDYGISATLPNVWRQCGDFNQLVPPIPYQDSFAYALPLSGAVYGARYISPSEEQHLSSHILRKLVPLHTTSTSSTDDQSNPSKGGRQDETEPQASRPDSLQAMMGDTAEVAQSTEAEQADHLTHPREGWGHKAGKMMRGLLPSKGGE